MWHPSRSKVVIICEGARRSIREKKILPQEFVGEGMKQKRIGVLTTDCTRKRMISERLKELYAKVHVGIPLDFENKVRDLLFISRVETAERVKGGKHIYRVFYDGLCLILALTRAT